MHRTRGQYCLCSAANGSEQTHQCRSSPVGWWRCRPDHLAPRCGGGGQGMIGHLTPPACQKKGYLLLVFFLTRAISCAVEQVGPALAWPPSSPPVTNRWKAV